MAVEAWKMGSFFVYSTVKVCVSCSLSHLILTSRLLSSIGTLLNSATSLGCCLQTSNLSTLNQVLKLLVCKQHPRDVAEFNNVPMDERSRDVRIR